MNPAEEALFAHNTDEMFKRAEDIEEYIEYNKYDVLYDYLMNIDSEKEMENILMSDDGLFEKYKDDIFSFVSSMWENYYKPERDYE